MGMIEEIPADAHATKAVGLQLPPYSADQTIGTLENQIDHKYALSLPLIIRSLDFGRINNDRMHVIYAN
jgi:hypothetical protein